MRPNTGLGFAIIGARNADSGAGRAVARFVCTSKDCDQVLDLPVKPGSGFNPEFLAKKAKQHGWHVDAHKAHVARCEVCDLLGSVTRNDPDSELRKVMPMTTAPVAQIGPREPTTDQRVAIRGLLDKHFDDSVGMYLDDMSDERVAEKVGVPRLIVEKMRETAYGPIRVDPVMVGLRAEVAQVKRDIETQQKALDTLKTRSMELGSRVEKALAGKAA